MNQLVFIDNGKTVTDSLTVAEVFGKRHDNVIRDIKSMECSREFSLLNFEESTYLNGQGREMPKYIITEKGFTLLVMGYTGREAMRFKEMYIAEFERMRDHIKSDVPKLTPNEAMAIALQQTAEMMTKVPVLENRIELVEQKVDEQITLQSGEQRRVQKAISQKVYTLESDPDARSELFRQLHREIKDRWQVASYKDIRRQDLLSVINYINAWVPIRRAG